MASEYLKELEDVFGPRHQLKFLSASLLRAQGEKQQARRLLEELVMVSVKDSILVAGTRRFKILWI